jgi:protoporphyrinogen oxidase
MKIAVIGAGITGLSAAYDLLEKGNKVILYEAGNRAGGLASGFRDEKWDWALEKFYHHLFTSDKSIIQLVNELGMRDQLFFPRPTTSVVFQDKIVPFDSIPRWIAFPGFNPLDVVRFGLVSAYLRFSKPWRGLEKVTADQWLRRWYGDKIYNITWRPMLIGKFGPYYHEANMAWMWARLHVRSPKLGYFTGGFQAFIDTLVAAVRSRGGEIHFNQPVQEIHHTNNHQLEIHVAGKQLSFDRVLSTTSPSLLARMAPSLPNDYLGKLLNLKSMGAVVLTLALTQPLLTQSNTYWLNIPADSPDKTQNEYPFLALVEHTNYINRRHYGGDHIIYCGDYVTPNHPYLTMAKDELEQLFTGVLNRFNPSFSHSWIRRSWLFRANYAQPIPVINHSQNIPDLRTPLPGLYLASMSQVYPWDRGTNYAVEIGRGVAQLIMEDIRSAIT